MPILMNASNSDRAYTVSDRPEQHDSAPDQADFYLFESRDRTLPRTRFER